MNEQAEIIAGTSRQPPMLAYALSRALARDEMEVAPRCKRKVADPNALLTAAQAAARLGITVEQLTAHVEDGSLRYINVGRGKKKPRRRFDSADLEEFKSTRSTLEQPCPSSSQKSPRRITGTASKLNVISFTALRSARMKKKPSGSKR